MLAYSSFCMHDRVESVNHNTQTTFHIFSILHAQPILSHYSLHYKLTELTAYTTFTVRLSSVLHDNPNTYSIGTLFKENVVAPLVNTSRLEFNSLCAIRIFHLYKILLLTLCP